MNLPFRAIISDLDGTLLNAEHKVGNFTMETLQKLSDKGVDIFLATGRNYPDVSHIISKLAISNAMLVTSNGARANNLDGKVILNHYLPEALAIKLMNIEFDPTTVCINSYQGDEWFINKDIEELKKYHQDSGFCYQVVDFATHHGRQTEKVFYIGKTAEALLPIEKYIKANYGEQVQMTYSTPLCLEVMAKGVCKANSLEELVKLRGYTLKDCIAFGDGMNDVEMLASVGKGCVMENADPRLKSALPHCEVIGRNRDEAVASYIRAIFGVV